MAKMKASERLKPIPKKTKEEIEKERLELRQKNELQELKNNVDSDHMFENASLDDYEKALENDVENEFSDSDRNEMSKTILSLRNELESLREENLKLTREIENLRTSTPQIDPTCSTDNIVSLKKNIETMKGECDALRSKNSELEARISRMTEVERMQQAKIDSFRHSYTQSNYNPSMTVRGGGYRTNINGYQDWR